MRNRSSAIKSRGFSLIELLVVMAVISSLAAMVLFNVTNIHGNSRTATTRMNANSICSMYQSARAVGATFQSATVEGIVDELIQGKRGVGPFATSHFQLSLAAEEKRAASALCAFDPASDTLTMTAGSR